MDNKQEAGKPTLVQKLNGNSATSLVKTLCLSVSEHTASERNDFQGEAQSTVDNSPDVEPVITEKVCIDDLLIELQNDQSTSNLIEKFSSEELKPFIERIISSLLAKGDMKVSISEAEALPQRESDASSEDGNCNEGNDITNSQRAVTNISVLHNMLAPPLPPRLQMLDYQKDSDDALKGKALAHATNKMQTGRSLNVPSSSTHADVNDQGAEIVNKVGNDVGEICGSDNNLQALEDAQQDVNAITVRVAQRNDDTESRAEQSMCSLSIFTWPTENRRHTRQNSFIAAVHAIFPGQRSTQDITNERNDDAQSQARQSVPPIANLNLQRTRRRSIFVSALRRMLSSGRLVEATLVEDEELSVIIAEPIDPHDQKRRNFAVMFLCLTLIAVCLSFIFVTRGTAKRDDLANTELVQPTSAPTFDPRNTLDIIQARGYIRCGLTMAAIVRGEGLMMDLCKSVAAVIL